MTTSLTDEEIRRVLVALRPSTAPDDPLCTKLWRMSQEQQPVLGPNDLAFHVPGEPVPKGRARSRAVTTKAGKSFVAHYTPEATRAFEDRVRLVCQSAVAGARWAWTPKDRFALTLRVFRMHEGKGGDVDNYVKAVGDAMNGAAFADDRHVRAVFATVAQDAERPRVEITLRKFPLGHAPQLGAADV